MTKENEKTETEVLEGDVLTEKDVVEQGQEEAGEAASLEQELEKARAQAAEYLDGWQRAQAEFSNYKKRQEADRAQMIAHSNVMLLRKLLPVVDDFDRAMASLPANLSQLTWCQGIFIIKQKIDQLLESEDIKPIEAEGQEFDPRFHEAVTYEEAEGYEEGQIVGEVQRGYMLGERVLRPTLVRVAKAPFAQPVADTENDENESNKE